MNPLRRQRLPPSIRNLLTDIGPKEGWEPEPEPEPEAREGILLPTRGATSTHEELLTPAQQPEENTGRMCMFCHIRPSCYTCPRCNLLYCGLACYQSPLHLACSEEFYKESVLHQLKDMGRTEADGRRKMQEILVGLRQKAHGADGGMKGLLQEAGVLQEDIVDAEERTQAVELLSRLAEIQETATESNAEIEEIMRKLEALGGEDDVEDECLVDQLSPLDVDKLSEEELWALLNTKEKEKFMGLFNAGAIGGLVPIWKPWWEEHESSGWPTVEVLNKELSGTTSLPGHLYENVTQKKARKQSSVQVPLISSKIPQLSSLCPNPSPLVCYSLVNALFCYTFTLFLFNGDTDSLMFEFIDMVVSLCEAFNSKRVFSSAREAVACGETLTFTGGHLEAKDSGAVVRAVEAVAHILTGRDGVDATGYCLSALSQLRSVFHRAKSALSKEGDEGLRQKYFLGGKKCEFFQAWVLGNSSQIRLLAVELWNEHGRRVGELNLMNQSKSAVERSLKKERKTLIEELKP